MLSKSDELHASREFVGFLANILSKQLHGKEFLVIAGNLAPQKMNPVIQFQEALPRAHFYFNLTNTYSDNQIELRSATIDRDVMARGMTAPSSDTR